jgi:hypothetical protein
MKKNMNMIDRIIRPLFAIGFLTLYFTDTVTGGFGILLLVLAVIFLLTSVIGYCPIYHVIGLCPLLKEKERLTHA